MASFDTEVEGDLEKSTLGSTDQCNVSYVCPSFHSGFSIETALRAYNLTAGLNAAAGSEDAYLQCLASARGMTCAAGKILSA
ncbi:hypothetical protein PENANT_c005G09329 [Penicillium antarcticum]|uniref:Uncharacterized protein n=1 Tax=Penicillium antarcticum TaxID=416450 RepID=A0A1V6QEX6_9EURO|nr:hypothetical protein PENANT_c005G09329 [Penicillium antarcticum]